MRALHLERLPRAWLRPPEPELLPCSSDIEWLFGESEQGWLEKAYWAEFLEELGNDVECDAKLTKLVHGGYDLYLDILKPPQI